MDLSEMDREQIASLGERIAAEFLHRHRFLIVDKNVTHEAGELPLVARKNKVMHFIEVKTTLCDELPEGEGASDNHNPSEESVRVAQWYVAEHNVGDTWQIDGILVWLRRRDGRALVRYLPQLV